MTVSTVDLSAVRDVRVADVYKAGRLAARLARTDQGVLFSYLPDYLDACLPPVATTLPLTGEPRLNAAGAVPPFFAGLLPEGRRLSSLRRAVKTSADDDLSLLLAVGRDPVGDVQVVPAGVHPEPAEALVTVSRSMEEITFTEVLEAAGVVDPVALAGVQDKASARMLTVPVGRAGERYILKIDPPEYQHLVVNENYFLSRARAGRLPVVEAEVVHDSTGRPGLLVRRFDRTVGPEGAVAALAVEDGAQVLGLYPADKYNVTTEQVVDAVARLCAARAIAARAVFQQLCYAWLTGNGDLHAKNVSIVGAPTGEWRVAPAYDLPSTLPYRDNTLALSVGGRRSGLSRRQLLTFADRVGLPARAATRVLDDVLAVTENLEEELSGGVLPFPPNDTRDVIRQLRRRRKDALAGA